MLGAIHRWCVQSPAKFLVEPKGEKTLNQVIRFYEYGNTDVLHVETEETPALSSGQVLVR
jgi:hypothetical protein